MGLLEHHAIRPLRRFAAPELATFFALLLAPAANAQVAILLDGFESCDGSLWSTATGVPDCSSDLVCAAQPAGKGCLAGRLVDVETSARICAPAVNPAPCTGNFALGGPCAIAVRAYDGVDFLNNPGGAAPLVTDETVVDGCGRFRLSGIALPGSTFAALSADDATGAPDVLTLAADFFPLPNQALLEHRRLSAMRYATDQTWADNAGLPGGSFAEIGAIVLPFLHAAAPAQDVQLRVLGSPAPDDDYYFLDVSPTLRRTPNGTVTHTFADGTALLLGVALTGVSGSGGEPAGCVWPQVLLGSNPGIVIVHELAAEVSGSPGTVCP